MALVAYASSDSGCSDEEDDNETAISTQRQSIQVVNKTVPPNHPTPTATVDHDGVNSADLTGDPHISDEEDVYPLTASTGGQGWSLPAPKHSGLPGNAPGPEIVLADDAGPTGLLLTGLPQPRALGSGDGGKVEATMEEDELEDIVKPRQEELALQEKPPGRKTRQPVKIVIPALQDRDEDDDREPSRKKMKPAPGKTGLLAFLPPPQQTITKVTNRPLIPHTLSKKPAPTRKPPQTLSRKEPASKKVTSLLPGVAGADDSDDDDDDESSSPSFFSFGDSGKEVAPVKPRPSVDFVQPVDVIAGPSPRPQGPVPLSGKTESESTPPDAPLQFRDRADAPLQFTQTQTRYPAPSHHAPSTFTGWSQAEDEVPQYDSMVSQNEADTYPDSQGTDTALQIEGDQLLRLQGRRRHGREEIHIIDVHGDDQRSEVEVTRNLTEEQQDMSHSRKKKDMPTRQQKNKHQITYLAYKAKEREFDLKNQWAQNKMTRRQTQAKYGF